MLSCHECIAPNFSCRDSVGHRQRSAPSDHRSLVTIVKHIGLNVVGCHLPTVELVASKTYGPVTSVCMCIAVGKAAMIMQASALILDDAATVVSLNRARK
jgi:hypothetical protein